MLQRYRACKRPRRPQFLSKSDLLDIVRPRWGQRPTILKSITTSWLNWCDAKESWTSEDGKYKPFFFSLVLISISHTHKITLSLSLPLSNKLILSFFIFLTLTYTLAHSISFSLFLFLSLKNSLSLSLSLLSQTHTNTHTCYLSLLLTNICTHSLSYTLGQLFLFLYFSQNPKDVFPFMCRFTHGVNFINVSMCRFCMSRS